MREIMQMVTEISGRRNKSCYYVLCRAVDIVRACQPGDVQMKTVCTSLKSDLGMSAPAVAKALSRAVDDIWDNGNHNRLEEIYGRPILERPSPKELVNVLAQHVWKE